MRIGVNSSLVATGGGVTYFANILPELAPLLESRGDSLVVYTRRGGRVQVPDSPALRESAAVPAGLSSIPRAAWEQTTLPFLAARDRLDVFFGPGDYLPLGLGCPTVCAFRNPNIYAPLAGEKLRMRPRLLALRALALASAHKCARAIFVSAAARDEIAPVVHLAPEKARVVHHGLGNVFRQALIGPRPWSRPYVLTVSTFYYYKNFVRLIEAYDQHVKRAGLPHGLVIVGELVEADYVAEVRAAIAQRGLQADVRIEGEVRYPAVGPWYRHASAFIFPSFRETFGHPLLEAMAADLPVAAADTSVMREIGGEVPVYFDPMSADSMGIALRRVLTDEDRTLRVERGRARLQQFTWRRTAEQTLRILDEAAGQLPGTSSAARKERVL